jgi:hypothetical protein
VRGDILVIWETEFETKLLLDGANWRIQSIFLFATVRYSFLTHFNQDLNFCVHCGLMDNITHRKKMRACFVCATTWLKNTLFLNILSWDVVWNIPNTQIMPKWNIICLLEKVQKKYFLFDFYFVGVLSRPSLKSLFWKWEYLWSFHK